MNIVLAGTVGSTAYGLATADSDVDTLGCFMLPNDRFLGFPPDSSSMTVVHTAPHPDATYHEIGKYLSLCLKGNPTAIELLWLRDYTSQTEIGANYLRPLRLLLLGAKPIHSAYGGYASQQAHRLRERQAEGKDGFSSDVRNRTAKHGRHCVRLLLQGTELLRTGILPIDMSIHRDFIFEAGQQASTDPEQFQKVVEYLFAGFNKAFEETQIPELPDRNQVESELINIRRTFGDS